MREGWEWPRDGNEGEIVGNREESRPRGARGNEN